MERDKRKREQEEYRKKCLKSIDEFGKRKEEEAKTEYLELQKKNNGDFFLSFEDFFILKLFGEGGTNLFLDD